MSEFAPPDESPQFLGGRGVWALPSVVVMLLSSTKAKNITGRKFLSVFTGARGTDLPPPFFLTFCLQIYFQ